MKPIVLAMVICDNYYRDAHTGKSILSGTFSSINSPAFSSTVTAPFMSLLTDVATQGKAQLIFRKEGGSFSMTLPPWEVEAPGSRRAVVEIEEILMDCPCQRRVTMNSYLWNDLR